MLNLTHRDGHAAPAPLPVGSPVTVRLALNDIAHRFPAGHRVRLALSSAYWPLLWPSPAAATLRLDLAGCRLDLPQRAPVASDDVLPDLPEPEAAPALRRHVLRPPAASRSVRRDQLAGVTLNEVRDDTGRYVLEDNGLEYELISVDRFAIAADDPLSARGDIRFDMRLGRGDWQTRAVTRTVLTATATDFVIEATLEAWDGPVQVAARSWHDTIPRNRV